MTRPNNSIQTNDAVPDKNKQRTLLLKSLCAHINMLMTPDLCVLNALPVDPDLLTDEQNEMEYPQTLRIVRTTNHDTVLETIENGLRNFYPEAGSSIRIEPYQQVGEAALFIIDNPTIVRELADCGFKAPDLLTTKNIAKLTNSPEIL